jgi:hypothetical protein
MYYSDRFLDIIQVDFGQFSHKFQTDNSFHTDFGRNVTVQKTLVANLHIHPKIRPNIFQTDFTRNSNKQAYSKLC